MYSTNRFVLQALGGSMSNFEELVGLLTGEYGTEMQKNAFRSIKKIHSL